MMQDGRTTATSPERQRKRSSRACDGCRARRSKCENVTEVAGVGATCRACRENKQRCEFSQPARKRGPKLAHTTQLDEETGEAQYSRQSQTGTPSPTSRTAPVDYVSGIPHHLVDQLLAVYFAHVHNVWPVISKCLFHPSTSPPHLLLSMMAVASCVAPHLARDGLDSNSLYKLAEHALHRRRSESRIDVIQSLVLLSLRQTGCGDKLSAAVYCGRACSMVYALGLHLAPSGSKISPNDVDTRSRVFWNCYVLDKTLSEETGRPFLLSYRRSSIPLPNINEVDEFEAWPPLPNSTTRLLPSVQHIPPRRGHILSCFAWTCRLGMVVEEILDLENEGPNLGDVTAWDEQFLNGTPAKSMATVERIEAQIDAWKAHLPHYLDFDPQSDVCPLPHVVVCLGWYHTCRILLYTRSKRLAKHSGQSPLTPVASVRPGSLSHRACSQSAQEVIDLIACLERHRLLGLVSADIIHIVCLATLCQVYDSKSSDPVLAASAKVNFNRCCRWLREFSATWSGASASKIFFDGLIRSGAHLSGSASHSDQIDSATSLTAIGRDLSNDNESKVPESFPFDVDLPFNVDPGLSSLIQLPQYYWNNLTDNAAVQPDIFSPDFDFLQNNTTMDPRHSISEGMLHTPAIPFDSLIQDQSGFIGRQMEPSRPSDAQADQPQGNQNQDAVFSALMRYMMGASRTDQ